MNGCDRQESRAILQLSLFFDLARVRGLIAAGRLDEAREAVEEGLATRARTNGPSSAVSVQLWYMVVHIGAVNFQSPLAIVSIARRRTWNS